MHAFGTFWRRLACAVGALQQKFPRRELSQKTTKGALLVGNCVLPEEGEEVKEEEEEEEREEGAQKDREQNSECKKKVNF